MKTSEVANLLFQWIFVLNSVKHSSMWVSLIIQIAKELTSKTRKFYIRRNIVTAHLLTWSDLEKYIYGTLF